MHINARTHTTHFGLSAAYITIPPLLVPLLLIVFLLFQTITAPPAYGQCFTGGIIHDFTGNYPDPSGVSLDNEGNVYGTTSSGGDNGLGLVYKLSQTVQNWLYAVLYSFTGNNNGNSPDGVIVGPNGVLYGTAQGGLQNNCGPNGCGVVYMLRPSPTACRSVSCSWNQTVLYRFTGSPDGASPNGNLVFDQAGNLYGTTGAGGAFGFGTVYELSPSNGGWTEKVLYSFSVGTDGYSPNSLVMGRDGNLYGTTTFGGDPNCGYGTCGVVFQLVPSGDQWIENVVHTFENTQNDGQNPQYLVQDGSGNLYGISTWMVGSDGFTGGVEFELSPSNGNWTYTELILKLPTVLRDFFHRFGNRREREHIHRRVDRL